jgi:hypothetical protein
MLSLLLLQGVVGWGFSNYAKPLSHKAPFVSAETCRLCHQAIAEQWETSRHAQSWSNALFQEGYIAEPDPFCVFCHAPHAEQREEIRKNEAWVRAMHPEKGSLLNIERRYPEPLSGEGINCGTCHVREGKIISSRPKPQAEHLVVVDPRLSRSEFCKGCHDFPILERHHGELIASSTSMQTTYQEWQEWRAAGGEASCQDCHMPEGRHDFHGANHRPLLHKSVQIGVSLKDGEVLFRLSTSGVGHNVPSGDLFRHLSLDLFIKDAWQEKEYIGRTFALRREENRVYKRMISDTSIRPGETRTYRKQVLPGTAWRLVYHYGSKVDEARALLPTSVLTEVLAEGRVP